MKSARSNIARRHEFAVPSAILAGALIVLAAAPTGAGAQQAARPPQPDFGRTERTFEAIQAEQRRAKSAAVPLPQAERPSVRGDTKPLFKLTAVAVEGAKLISGDVIAQTYRPYLGKTVSPADLVAIARKISDLYRQAGYHLSRAIVPAQDIKNGRIRINVLEGRIAEIVLKGDRAAQFGIGAILDVLTAENPARRATLERQLLLVNDLPGVRIADTALEEIGVGTGLFRLIVQIETWLNYTAVSLDNRGTPAFGPLQAYLSSSFNSAAVSGDTLGVNLSTVPDATKELRFGRLFYNAPIGIDGARIGALTSFSDIRPGDERRALDTRDTAQTYELRGSIVPMRSRDSSLWLMAAANYGDFKETDVLGTNYFDHIRTVSLTADYQSHDQLDGWNYLTLTARQGLGIFDASRKGDPLLSRSDGSGIFSKLEMSYTRYQKLSDVWSLKMSTAGQLASNALLASQEFYLGAAFGRGYYGAEFSGDNAIAGSLELRFDQVLKNDFIKGYQLYGYVDKTVAWNFHSGNSDPLLLSLVGAGVRLYLANEFQAGVEVSVPLEYRTPAEQPRDPRAFFYVSKYFKLCPGSAEMRCS